MPHIADDWADDCLLATFARALLVLQLVFADKGRRFWAGCCFVMLAPAIFAKLPRYAAEE
jgi:hypothetical protein